MPYHITKKGSGFKVTTPNHPQGFSKHPQTKAKAIAQFQAIKANTKPETHSVEPIFADPRAKMEYERMKNR